MAVRIPGTPLSDATIDTDRGGMPHPRADQTLANALQGLGNAAFGAAVDFQEIDAKKNAFDDEAKFLLHREQTETAYTEALRQAPADGSGIKDGFAAARQKPDEAFLASISLRNREKYALKLDLERSNYLQKADAAEYKARGDYELSSLNAALDVELRKIANDPNHKAKAVETLGTLLGNTAALDAAAKAEIKRKMAERIDETAVTGKYGGDPISLSRELGVPLPRNGHVAGGSPIYGKATAYGPGGGPQEGPTVDMRGGPVATLEDYAAGRSREITIAGNKAFEGRKYTIPTITFTDSTGATKTLKDVPAVVRDTGDAFAAAPEGRFDIPVARGMSPAALSKQPFSGQDLQFIPSGAREKSRIVSGDADMRNLSPSAKGLLDGIAATGVLPEIKVVSGFRDADRNAAAGGAKGSQHIHGNAIDIDVSGLSDEQKSALLQAAIVSGARGIGIYKSGNSLHLDTRGAPAFWGPSKDGAYAGADVSEFPSWAQPHLTALRDGKILAPGNPEYSAIPFARRQQLVEQAVRQYEQAQLRDKAQMKAGQTSTKEQLNLSIANDDPGVTIAGINELAKSGALDIGDAAALIEKLKTQEEKNAGVSEFLARMAKGELVAAPFDTEGNKFADGAYEKLKKAAPAEAHQPIAEEIAKAHGSAPKDYVQAIMGDIASIDQPDKVLAGLQRAQRLMGASKTALGRGEYQRVESAAVMFRHFVEDLGMTQDEAARKYMAVTDPAKRKSVDEATAEKEAKRLTVGDVTNAFDGTNAFDAIFIWEPSAGNTRAQSAAMLGDYRELFKMEYMQTGDAAAAKAKALDHFKKSYGITRLSGSNVLMKHPPENYYPPIDDSHDWMQKQVVEAVKQVTGKDYEPSKVFVVTTTATDADVRAKRPPAYEVWVEDKDANGYAEFKPVTGRGRFVFDPMAALNKPEAMAKRQAEMARREKAKQDIDNAGWWWEFATRALAP